MLIYNSFHHKLKQLVIFINHHLVVNVLAWSSLRNRITIASILSIVENRKENKGHSVFFHWRSPPAPCSANGGWRGLGCSASWPVDHAAAGRARRSTWARVSMLSV